MKLTSSLKRFRNLKNQNNGVRIYQQPNFLVQRSATRRFLCKDKRGEVVVEFVGMSNLTDYVAKETGKNKKPLSKNYIKQRVYKSLNKPIEFLGYRWSDR